MIHRATGRIVGPIAPISREDWPFTVIRDDEVLWRYFDYTKFEDLLRSSTLYFSRPDRFHDPFEGRFSPGNKQTQSESDRIFRSLYSISTSPDSEKYHDIHRTVVFISCWHRNTSESLQMWNAYTKSPDSVVVTTSARALRLFLPQNLMKYAVKCAPLDFPRTEFSHNSLFFYKPDEYRFEREFRILRSPADHEAFHPDKEEDRFRRVPIRLKKIVHRVITHPAATTETKERVERLMQAYLPARRRENSAFEVK